MIMLCKKISWRSVESSFSFRAERFPTKVRRVFLFFIKTRKTSKGKYYLQDTNFPQKTCSSRTFPKFLRQCWRMFCSQSEHSDETQNFLEETVQSNISFGHIKCSFDEPGGSFYRTPKTFSLNFRWKTWIFSEENINHTQIFSLTQHFLTKVRKVFDQYSKKL